MSDPSQESTNCCDCSELFSRPVLSISGLKFGSNRCDPCIERFSDQTRNQRQTDANNERESKWVKICPASYRDTIPTDPRLNRLALNLCNGWDAAKSVRGLGLIGSTGLGKTRCLFLALRRAHDAGRKCASISHTKLSRIAMDAFSGNGEERGEARAVLQSLHRADVLLIDDLGKPPSTERADSELEELVEDRTSQGRPILWTANGSGEWLIKRLGPDRGEPTARRLAEFCQIETLGGAK